MRRVSHKMRFGFALAVGLLTGSFLSGTSHAQDRLTLSSSQGGAEFQENFSGNTKVSGSVLVGLAFSAPGEKVDEDLIFVATKGSPEPRPICVQMMTADGRYWAANLYETNRLFDTPPPLEFPTEYGAQLKQYFGSEFLVVARLTDDCRRILGRTILPAIIGPKTEKLSLVAQLVVSRGRTQAWIESGGATVLGPISCARPDGGPQAAYTQACEFEGAAALTPGRYDLVIEVQSLTGAEHPHRYPLLLE